MYRRLILFGVAVAAVALTSMVIPLALGARDVVQIQKLGEAASGARAAALHWEALQREQGPTAVPEPADDEVTYIGPDGGTVGVPPRPDSAGVVQQARAGLTTTAFIDGWGYAATPAYLVDGRVGVVLVSLSPASFQQELLPRLIAIGAVALALLGMAALASWRLARQTVAPLTALAETADRVAEGDLTARAPSSDLPEIDQVGTALNRMTERVQELLAEERSTTAELAHQMRTPLTVLSIDIDGVADTAVRMRLRDDFADLQRMADEIIDAARRPVREGLSARCDAADVVAGRVGFWRVLADDQGRSLDALVSATPCWVRLTEQDLATAVDILLQNVFVHTPDGTALRVEVHEMPDGLVEVVVADEGKGFAPRIEGRPGSTGLGLSIAAKLAEASGGRLETTTSGGARAALLLGPPPSDR